MPSQNSLRREQCLNIIRCYGIIVINVAQCQPIGIRQQMSRSEGVYVGHGIQHHLDISIRYFAVKVEVAYYAGIVAGVDQRESCRRFC